MKASPLAALSPQQVRVLRLTLRGWSRAQIAREMAYSEASVAFHTRAIYAKLGLTDGDGRCDRKRLCDWAWEHGLLVVEI